MVTNVMELVYSQMTNIVSFHCITCPIQSLHIIYELNAMASIGNNDSQTKSIGNSEMKPFNVDVVSSMISF